MPVLTTVLAQAASGPASAPGGWIGAAGIAGLVAAVAAFFLSIGTIVLAVRLKAVIGEDSGKRDLAFVEELKSDVKEHSRRIDERFLAKASTAPDSLESLRAHLRGLRQELSEPMAFLARMATVPVTAFPEPGLSSAFGAWAGAVRALHEAVDNYYRDTSYAGEEIGIRRETYLLRQYGAEHEQMVELRRKVKGGAAKIDKIAGKYIDAHKPAKGHPAAAAQGTH